MAEKLIHIFKAFLNILFPQKCVSCGAKNEIFCRKCLESLPYPENCIEVGLRYKWIFAATSYKDEAVKKAIRLFKYHGIKILAAPLAELIYRRLWEVRLRSELRSEIERSQTSIILIPIPLSKKRLRQRGYNQTELLGHFLSDKLSIKMATNVLYKIKETVSQMEIKDRDERLKNLQGAFKIKNPKLIKNKIVILIDDITTTGATLNQAKRVLIQAGTKRVIGVVVAKG
jgi:ComF family protein